MGRTVGRGHGQGLGASMCPRLCRATSHGRTVWREGGGHHALIHIHGIKGGFFEL